SICCFPLSNELCYFGFQRLRRFVDGREECRFHKVEFLLMRFLCYFPVVMDKLQDFPCPFVCDCFFAWCAHKGFSGILLTNPARLLSMKSEATQAWKNSGVSSEPSPKPLTCGPVTAFTASMQSLWRFAACMMCRLAVITFSSALKYSGARGTALTGSL